MLIVLQFSVTAGVVCFRKATYGAVDACEAAHYCAARLLTEGCEFSHRYSTGERNDIFNTAARTQADYGCDLFGAKYRCSYQTNETGSCWNVTDGQVAKLLISHLLTLLLSGHSASLLLRWPSLVQ